MASFSDYSPKIRARARQLASKLYEPKSLDLTLPENTKSRDQIEAVLVMYCEEAKKDLRGAAAEAQANFERARQAATDAARAAEDASEEAQATEAEADLVGDEK